MDPETIDLPAPEPRVSVSEAIKIAQMNQGGSSGRGLGRGGVVGAVWEDDGSSDYERRIEELSDRLRKKLNRLRDRLIREEGYSVDPDTGDAVPPEWIRDPDYVAKGAG